MRRPSVRLTLAGALWALTAGLSAQGPFYLDDRLSAALWQPPYGLKLGGELGASWLAWGDDPLPRLPPAGLILGSPWKFGFARLAVDGNSSGATDHAGVTALLEPLGIVQFKAGLAQDWQVQPAGGTWPGGVDALGRIRRRSLETELIPLPWAYGYAGYDGTWEQLTSSGGQAGGFVDPSSYLIGAAGGDVLVTHILFVEWIPRPAVNVLIFTVLQGFQASGERGNIEGVRVDLPRGRLLSSLVVGRWQRPHETLPAFAQLSFTWVGARALDR
jgi:hypothetical protein